MKDIRSRVLDYNADWLRDSDRTEAEMADFAETLLDGQPTRTITVSPIGSLGKEYRITVTDGVYRNGFAAAEEPKVFRLKRRDGREDIEAVARKRYGRDLPEGFELRSIRHH